LISFEIILLFKFRPNLNFVNEIGKHFGDLFKHEEPVPFFIYFLQCVAVYVNQEFVRVNVLRKGYSCKEHVDEVIHSFGIEVTF